VKSVRTRLGSKGCVACTAGNAQIDGSDIDAGHAAIDTTGATGNIGIQAHNIAIDPSQDAAQAPDQQTSGCSGVTFGVTGKPLDVARNLHDAGSSGNAHQRATGVAHEAP
jgi:filamentous hemagglutinin